MDILIFKTNLIDAKRISDIEPSSDVDPNILNGMLTLMMTIIFAHSV